jgi:hypothetical protein
MMINEKESEIKQALVDTVTSKNDAWQSHDLVDYVITPTIISYIIHRRERCPIVIMPRLTVGLFI